MFLKYIKIGWEYAEQYNSANNWLLNIIILLLDYNKWNRAISQTSTVFTNDPGDLGSIPGRVILKTQKKVPDVALLNTQHYKVRIKGKVGQSRERNSAFLYTSV